MANTTLRAYLDDLDRLLDQEALEEVIGHCRHILQYYPKNIETYRILGRALLDKGRGQEAGQVFQRVLGAIPDDLTAHLGMSSAYEETNKPLAIWHLERAFEIQPDNQALQEELKRLYTLRDGTAPARLQMTPGALARIYLKGQLYGQAVVELQNALEKHPERTDLLLLLARTVWEDDRPVEASDLALKVLDKLPDCLEANRILATLWLAIDRPSDAEPFIARVEQIDPFLAWDIVHPDGPPVPHEAFQLERLNWDVRAAATLATDVPDWVATIGDVFDAPDAYALSDAPPEAVSVEPSSLPKSGILQRSKTGSLAAETTVQSDAPDWLKDVDLSTPAPVPSFAMPDWSQPAAPSSAQPADDVPDWLADVVGTTQAASAAPEPIDPMAWLTTGPLPGATTQPAPAMDWSAEDTGQIETASVDDTFDLSWLTEDSAPVSPQVGLLAMPDQPQAAPAVDTEPLAWLDAQPAQTEASAPAAPLGSELPDQFSTPDTLDWLSSAALPPAPADDQLGLDWLLGDSQPPAQPAQLEHAGEMPQDSAQEAQPVDQTLPMAWFAEDLAPEAAASEPTPAADEISLDWLGVESAAQPSDEPTPAADEISLDWLGVESTAQPPEDAAALSWLQPSPQPSPDEPQPAVEPDSLEWLVSGTSALTAPQEPTPAPAAQDDGLSWLMTGPLPSLESLPANADLPDWLIGSAPAVQPQEQAPQQAPQASQQTTPQAQEGSSEPIEDAAGWMQQFGFTPAVPETQPSSAFPSEPLAQIALDQEDMDEFETLKQAFDMPLDGSPEEVSTLPVEALSDEALSWLQASPEPPTRSRGKTAPMSETPPAPAQPAEPVLEDEWLAGFEPLETGSPATTGVTETPSGLDQGEEPLSALEDLDTAFAQSAALPSTVQSDGEPAWTQEAALEPLASLEDVPLWMREPEQSSISELEDPFENLLKLATEKASQSRSSDTGVLDQGEVPDWLTALSGSANEPTSQSAPPSPGSPLADLVGLSDALDSVEVEVEEDSTPSWLRRAEAQEASEVLVQDEGPDWLKQIDTPPAQEADLSLDSIESEQEAPLAAESIPDWLQAMSPQQQQSAPVGPQRSLEELDFESLFTGTPTPSAGTPTPEPAQSKVAEPANLMNTTQESQPEGQPAFKFDRPPAWLRKKNTGQSRDKTK